MSPKIIVSYDGTANEDDAVTFGRLLGEAGATLALAYVRHAAEPDSSREDVAQHEAEQLLDRGAALLGADRGDVARHVVTDRSTPEGLGALAAREQADAVLFCSDSHTARGHIAVGNSAQRLLEGGSVAIGIAPVDLADTATGSGIRTIVAIGDGDGGARDTAASIAQAVGGTVAPVVNDETDLLVIDSRPEAGSGRVWLSSSAAHLIETATCPVLVLPRGVALSFGRTPSAAAA